MRVLVLTILVAATVTLAGFASAAGAAGGAAPPLFESCKALNKTFPHGVGRANATDRTSGVQVRNFKRHTALYRVALRFNKRLDRDRDGIACERA